MDLDIERAHEAPVLISRSNISAGASAIPAPCIAASTIKRGESNTGPRTGRGAMPAAPNQSD